MFHTLNKETQINFQESISSTFLHSGPVECLRTVSLPSSHVPPRSLEAEGAPIPVTTLVLPLGQPLPLSGQHRGAGLSSSSSIEYVSSSCATREFAPVPSTASDGQYLTSFSILCASSLFRMGVEEGLPAVATDAAPLKPVAPHASLDDNPVVATPETVPQAEDDQDIDSPPINPAGPVPAPQKRSPHARRQHLK